MTETWRPVVGFEGQYEVSDLGRVRSLYTGRLLAPCPHTGGYAIVHLYAGGLRSARTIHRLVLEAFVGPRTAEQEALHANHVRTDNRLVNLSWGTRQENEDAKKSAGRAPRGEANATSKLRLAEVLEIRSRRGELQKDLGEEFGCTFSNISVIQRRKSWRHV